MKKQKEINIMTKKKKSPLSRQTQGAQNKETTSKSILSKIKCPVKNTPVNLWAEFYNSKGFSLIPLKSKNKTPAISSWKEFQERKATDKELNKWFGNSTTSNIAIVTGKISGIIVVDFDSEEAIRFARDNNLLQTLLVKTGKGYHAYYKCKNSIKNQVNVGGIQIDIRGEGGYVVAPPSTHPLGKKYKWAKGKGLDDVPLAELPDIISEENPEDKTPLKELYKGVSEGERNDTLARLVGSWVNDGLSFEECLENAYLWNSKNAPPLPNKEVERTVKSIYEKHHESKKRKELNSECGQYFIDSSGYLCRYKQTKDGYLPVRLANFQAQIKEEIIEDNGIEQTYRFLVEGKIKDRQLPEVDMLAKEFTSLNWLFKWGTQAVLEPGTTIKDFVRHFIRLFSHFLRYW